MVISDSNIDHSIEIESYSIKETTLEQPGLIINGCPSIPDDRVSCRTIRVPTDMVRVSGRTIPEFEYQMTIKTKDGQELTLKGKIQVFCSSAV